MDDKVLNAINDLDKKLDKKFDQKFKNLDNKFNEKFEDLDHKFDHKFDDLGKKLDNQFEEKFISLFNQGFEEIVRPEIEYLREEMEGRFDKGESDMSDVKGRLASLDRKVDRIAAKQLDQDIEFKDHNKRLRKVEISARAA